MRSVLSLVFVALILFVSQAKAADWSDTRLDEVASSIAGHSVHVYCENDQAQWHSTALGYTFPPNEVQTVWVHPYVCQALHDTLDGKGVALMAKAQAIHVLVHESTHQRGGIFSDCFVNGPSDLGCEARTDCMALSLDVGVAVRYFGFGPVERVTHKIVGKRKHRHRVRVVTQVVNPDLPMFEWYVHQMHKSLPAAYQGDC